MSMHINKDKESEGAQALGISIASLLTWIVPLIGIPVSATSIVLGIRARSTTKGVSAAIIGSFTIIFAFINSAIGAYLGSQ